MRLKHQITFSADRGVPPGEQDGDYGDYSDTVTALHRTPSMPQMMPAWDEDALTEMFPAKLPPNWKPVALTAFMGMLVLSPNSSMLTRLVAAGFGASALFGEGGLLKR